jgi:hypothetical protein
MGQAVVGDENGAYSVAVVAGQAQGVRGRCSSWKLAKLF